jgi:hypothetical protein
MVPPFLTSALEGGMWSASPLCRFTTGERAPRRSLEGGRPDPRAGLDAVKKKSLLRPVAPPFTERSIPTPQEYCQERNECYTIP